MHNRTIDMITVGEWLWIKGKKYVVQKVYPYFLYAVDVETGARNSFNVGDLVMAGVEPSDIYGGRDIERKRDKAFHHRWTKERCGAV